MSTPHVVVMGVAGTGKTTIGPPARGPARRSVRRGRTYFHPPADIAEDHGLDPLTESPTAGRAGRHRPLGARPARARRSGQQFGVKRSHPDRRRARRPESSSSI